MTAMRQTGVSNVSVTNDTARSFILCTKASRSDTSKAMTAPFLLREYGPSPSS